MTKEDRKKWYKRALLAGAVLGLFCNLLPPEYRAVCKAIADVCSAGSF